MLLSEFERLLTAAPTAVLHFMLPDGAFVPAHFHVTEVGRVRKDFIDCGGIRRSTEVCVLQLWVADDSDHRLDAGKLVKILRLAAPLMTGTDLPLEVEYDVGYVTQLPISAAEVTPAGLLFHLGGKHTDCLAPDRCGVAGASCGPAECC
jgi:hypothetical protein